MSNAKYGSKSFPQVLGLLFLVLASAVGVSIVSNKSNLPSFSKAAYPGKLGDGCNPVTNDCGSGLKCVMDKDQFYTCQPYLAGQSCTGTDRDCDVQGHLYKCINGREVAIEDCTAEGKKCFGNGVTIHQCVSVDPISELYSSCKGSGTYCDNDDLFKCTNNIGSLVRDCKADGFKGCRDSYINSRRQTVLAHCANILQ